VFLAIASVRSGLRRMSALRRSVVVAALALFVLAVLALAGLSFLRAGASQVAGLAQLLVVFALPVLVAVRLYRTASARIERLNTELAAARYHLERQRGELELQARELDARNDALVMQRRMLEAQTDAVDAAQATARAADRAKSEFLAVMSHEVRTPLSAIIGFARFLTAPDMAVAPDQAKRYLERISLNAHRLLALIDDILDYSRLEAGHVPLELGPVNLAAVVRDVAFKLAPCATAKGMALRVELPERHLTLETDAVRLTQLLLHVVGNAVKFTEHGSVTLAVLVEGDATDDITGAGPACVVEIRDTGVGIPAERRDAVFEPFLQAEMGETRRHGGTGLGLAIARALCTLLGATLVLESTEGVGTTVRIRFASSLPSSTLPATASSAQDARRVA
jgi:signal transduction histidine kinase